MTDLQLRLAAALVPYYRHDPHQDASDWSMSLAVAALTELDLGIPCAATGCRMRQIARRHADASSRLKQSPAGDMTGDVNDG